MVPGYVTLLYFSCCFAEVYHNSYNNLGNPAPIDLVITLGGDGTILHASSLFPTGAVPPVLSFSMGTLGFLLPFRAYSSPAYLSELDRLFSIEQRCVPHEFR